MNERSKDEINMGETEVVIVGSVNRITVTERIKAPFLV